MNKIRLGLSISLSGKYAIQGRESFEGISLWVKNTNSKGGIRLGKQGGRLPVELVYYDDESSADKCRRITEKLIADDRVDILIGPYSSGHTLAAAEVAEGHRKVLWNHGGSSDEIFNKGFKYLVSTITPASRYMAGIIEMVRKLDGEAKGIALFSAKDSGFSTSVASGAKEHALKNGFYVTEFKYLSGTKDLSSELCLLREKDFDVILGVGRAEDDLALAEQILEEGIYAKAIGLVVAAIKEFKEALGEKAEGFLGPSQWEPGIGIKPDFGPTPREFFHEFKRAYGKEPDYTAAQGYNIGLIIQRCIEESQTLDNLVLREKASELTFKTFYGDFKIEPSTGNQIAHRTVIVQWQGGVKYVVYPQELAERKPIYPRPKT
jgi:branched-chain amino acid transport system substrate-binding protein